MFTIFNLTATENYHNMQLYIVKKKKKNPEMQYTKQLKKKRNMCALQTRSTAVNTFSYGILWHLFIAVVRK